MSLLKHINSHNKTEPWKDFLLKKKKILFDIRLSQKYLRDGGENGFSHHDKNHSLFSIEMIIV